jgi:hypothetical protein
VKREALILAGLLAAFSLGAQQYLEVRQSQGFVEALLSDQGWRQAVVGRQLPAGAVLTSWIDASATVAYQDSVLTVEPLTHLTVLEVGTDLVRLSLEAGGLKVQSPSLAWEIRFRGLAIRLKGAAAITDGTLTVTEGSAEVSAEASAAGRAPVKLAAGRSVDLLARQAGPVFTSAPGSTR